MKKLKIATIEAYAERHPKDTVNYILKYLEKRNPKIYNEIIEFFNDYIIDNKEVIKDGVK